MRQTPTEQPNGHGEIVASCWQCSLARVCDYIDRNSDAHKPKSGTDSKVDTMNLGPQAIEYQHPARQSRFLAQAVLQIVMPSTCHPITQDHRFQCKASTAMNCRGPFEKPEHPAACVEACLMGLLVPTRSTTPLKTKMMAHFESMIRERCVFLDETSRKQHLVLILGRDEDHQMTSPLTDHPQTSPKIDNLGGH